MIYLKENRLKVIFVFVSILMACKHNNLPEIAPTLITEQTPHDTDDPAIWVNSNNPEKSIVFGTDKDETNGGVYAFGLDGKIIADKSLTGLQYPNNVDVAYDFKLNDSVKTDILVFTEREANQMRVFSIPYMKPLDSGGFKVFQNEEDIEKQRPMGISCYSSPDSGDTFIIVGRKVGPKANYLCQYKLVSDSTGISANLVRRFGNFSGKKEIEAIAVDNEMGYVYYSDEDHCIRKYYADPKMGNNELACFGSDHFRRDIEGIAIVKYKNNSGYLIVSNQQAHSFCVFDRKTNEFVKEINLGTSETDGCDVTSFKLGDVFPKGLFVSMNDNREFYFHGLEKLGLVEN